MEEIAEELESRNIPFDRDGNRIRYVLNTPLSDSNPDVYFLSCFPHVINIAVKAALKALSDKVPDTLPHPNPCPPLIALTNLDPNPPPNQATKVVVDYAKEYRKALLDDIISKVRRFVTTCRASGQRLKKFLDIIREGNKAGGFGNPKILLRVIGLLKDVDTRWSSIFMMTDRFLEQLPVNNFLIFVFVILMPLHSTTGL